MNNRKTPFTELVRDEVELYDENFREHEYETKLRAMTDEQLASERIDAPPDGPYGRFADQCEQPNKKFLIHEEISRRLDEKWRQAVRRYRFESGPYGKHKYEVDAASELNAIENERVRHDLLTLTDHGLALHYRELIEEFKRRQLDVPVKK